MKAIGIVLTLGLLLSGCSTVEVTELSRGRTHQFNYAFDGERMLLKGKLSIEESKYSVEIYYDKEKSALVRGDECLEFPPGKVLFGFLPPFGLVGADVTIAEAKEYPQRYTITENSSEGTRKSLVAFSNEIVARGNVAFDRTCADGEQLINVQ